MSSLTPRIDKIQKNYIINGDLNIWQRGTGPVTVNTATTTYTFSADRFGYVSIGSTVKNYSIQRSTDVPSSTGSTFQYSMLFSCLTAITSPASSDIVQPFRQRIEGFNYAEMHGKPITISFWIKTNKTGNHPLSLYSDPAARYYVTSFTVNAANTWEKKVISLTLDSSGTYDFSNGAGLNVAICSGAVGSTYNNATLNSWTNYPSGSPLVTHPSLVNIMDSNTNTLKITGVKVEIGTNSDPEFSLAGRNYVEELALCKRYYEKCALYGDTFACTIGANSSQASFSVQYEVEKRTANVTGTWDGDGNNWRVWANSAGSAYYYGLTNGGTTIVGLNAKSIYVTMTSTSAMSTYISGSIQAAAAGAYIAADAEL